MNIRQIFLCVCVGFLLTACQGVANPSAQTPGDVAQAQAPSAAEQVQAALAQTQLAQVNSPLSDEEIQTAIASTQIVVTSVPLVNQQIAMAIAQTQQAVNAVSLSDSQIQTAIAEVQVVSVDNELSEDTIQAAILRTEEAFAPQNPALQELSTPTPEMLQVQGAGVDDFNGAYLYSHGPVFGHKYFFTIQLTAEIQGKYNAKIGDTVYTCQSVDIKPNRLYCQGRSVKGGSHTIQIFEDGTQSLVFTSELIFPEWTPTRPVAPTKCICKGGIPYLCPDGTTNGCCGNGCCWP